MSSWGIFNIVEMFVRSDYIKFVLNISKMTKRKRSLELDNHADKEIESGDDDSSDNIINVEFEFFDPRPVDFKSTRRLIQSFVPGKEATFAASDMADAIIAQVPLGTMIKVTDDLDVYGFATILNVRKHEVCNLRSSYSFL